MFLRHFHIYQPDYTVSYPRRSQRERWVKATIPIKKHSALFWRRNTKTRRRDIPILLSPHTKKGHRIILSFLFPVSFSGVSARCLCFETIKFLRGENNRRTLTVNLLLVLLSGTACWDRKITMGLFTMVTQIQNDCGICNKFLKKSN